MAAVALVMGLVIIQRTMLDDAPSAPSDDRGPSAVAPSPSAEEQRMALAPTLVDPTPQRPTRQGPEATSETTTEPAVAPIAAPEVDPAPSASSSPASPPARPRTASAPKTSAPKKVSPPAKPRPAAVRRPAPKPQAQAAPAPAPKTASDPALAQAPRMVVKPSELEAGAASPQPAAASPAAGSPAPGSAAPGAATKKPAQAPSGGANAKQFRTDLARQQMGIAAGKAATCGQAGKAHGAGKVRVLIESWGRVAQVTHLNQSFVGTPVGLCVMQAFQQVRVPPFEGGAQTLTASFTVPPPTPPAATAPATPAPQSPQ